MKDTLKKIVIAIITIEAGLILRRYKPKIIAVTGSVGKTTTKDMIFYALANSYHVRKNSKSLNSEIGVPLTIIGTDSGWSNLFIWIKIICLGLFRIFWNPNYPEWLVLETGIDRPGDMKKTASWLKPFCAVFTTFGEIPVHVEFFDGPEGVMKEKSKLLDYVRPDGCAVLNQDDPNVAKLKNVSNVKTFTYSNSAESDIFATNYQIIYVTNSNGIKLPQGISFKLNYQGNVLPVSIKGVVGNQYVYGALSAITTAIAVGIPVIKAVEGISDYKPLPGRMNIIMGLNDSVVIDDTYNASPVAMRKAVETLGEIECSGIKIAILGDMLELGRFSKSEHRKIGELALIEGVDVLIACGLRAEAIAEAAYDSGIPAEKIHVFKKSTKAMDAAKVYAKPGNVFLVKGSQGMRMERIVEVLMADPSRKSEMLVRQDKEWQNR